MYFISSGPLLSRNKEKKHFILIKAFNELPKFSGVIGVRITLILVFNYLYI